MGFVIYAGFQICASVCERERGKENVINLLVFSPKGLPRWCSVKNLPANAEDTRDVGSIPGLGRSPGGGHGNPLQYSCLENFMDKGDWWAIVHRIPKNGI